MLRSLSPLLGCGLMLVVCMSIMGLTRGRPGGARDPSDDVATLRAEVARLRGLDEQRSATATDPPSDAEGRAPTDPEEI